MIYKIFAIASMCTSDLKYFKNNTIVVLCLNYLHDHSMKFIRIRTSMNSNVEKCKKISF